MAMPRNGSSLQQANVTRATLSIFPPSRPPPPAISFPPSRPPSPAISSFFWQGPISFRPPSMSRYLPLFRQEPMCSPRTLRLTISSATVHSKSQFEGRAPMPRASCAGARPPRSLTPSLRPRPCTLFRTPCAHVASQRAARHQVQASLRHAHIFLAIHPRNYIQPPAIRFAAYGSISPPAQTSQN